MCNELDGSLRGGGESTLLMFRSLFMTAQIDQAQMQLFLQFPPAFLPALCSFPGTAPCKILWVSPSEGLFSAPSRTHGNRGDQGRLVAEGASLLWKEQPLKGSHWRREHGKRTQLERVAEKKRCLRTAADLATSEILPFESHTWDLCPK